MARYSVQLAPGAERDLAALDKPVQRRVAARIDALAENPKPAGVAKLQGEADAWRVRVGDYRILYTIEHARLVAALSRWLLASGDGPLGCAARFPTPSPLTRRLRRRPLPKGRGCFLPGLLAFRSPLRQRGEDG